MSRMSRWYTNIKIQKKMFILIIFVIALILTIIAASTKITSNIAIEQANEQFAMGIKELSVNMDNYFQLIERSFDYIANNSEVQEELNSSDPYTSDETEIYSYYSRAGEIRRLLLQGFSSIYMNDIQLYGYNGAKHLLSNYDKQTIVQEEDALQKATDANGRCTFYNVAAESGMVYVIRLIKDSLTRKQLGYLRASVKVSYLEKISESTCSTFSSDIVLLDENNKVIFSSIDDFELSALEDNLSGTNGSFKITQNHKRYYCSYKKSSNTGFTLVGLQITKYANSNAWRQERLLLIVFIIALLICVILTKLLSNQIAKPIIDTSAAMEKFAEGDFTVRLPEGRNDEIGTMNAAFNHTIQRVELLLKQVVDMERINRDVQFQALQAQINPHFLYNVLDTINWMARKKGEEEICHMISAISNLMRESLSNKKNYISVKQELKYITDYIYIQETRYQHRFTADIEIDEELYDLKIPKMTLQTLVENAIVHGVEDAIWDCYLYVDGHAEDGYAVFRIKDNGVGIREETLKELLSDQCERKDYDEVDRHTKFGIFAIKSRLRYAYDNNATFHIISEKDKGTEVIVRIPLEIAARDIYK